ncbi:esterase/lipase [Penicillium soppii]|uniref:esterase/lipase n=1 Tax=Penicillium soppii TaxID=69789 RepID=UPI00254897A0|nr:esterase/lipase [Penicillium soppii]KAJ5882589.1 esterase/lipase [Penicillium soppii]
MSPDLRRPQLHPDLSEVHNTFPSNEKISSREELEIRRKALNFSLEDTICGKEDVISHEEEYIPGPTGLSMKASIFRPKAAQKGGHRAPGILHIHGGGHCSGNRFMGVGSVLGWVEQFGAVIVSPEYRLAPENPQPAQIYDSYAALEWMCDNAEALGISKDKIIVCGGSAGGNLAAGVVLLARDRSGPKILGQLLMYPWLDNSNTTVSMQQFGDVAPWTKSNSIDAGKYALGEHGENATMYTVPSLAKDLAGLPPTFIDVGEADVFRDEDVDYASALWKAGVSTELHVWPGCWHAFDVFVPDAPISRRAQLARSNWLDSLIYSQ